MQAFLNLGITMTVMKELILNLEMLGNSFLITADIHITSSRTHYGFKTNKDTKINQLRVMSMTYILNKMILGKILILIIQINQIGLRFINLINIIIFK